MKTLPVVNGVRPSFEPNVEFVVYDDVNANADISSFATRQGVRYVPTMVLVSSKGEELERVVGEVSDAALRRLLDSAR